MCVQNRVCDGARRALLAAGFLAPAPAGLCLDPRDIFVVGAGPVVLRPTFDFTTSYNDNIYSLPDESILTELGLVNSREDLIFMMSPAINARLGRPDGDNRVALDARFDQYVYTENPDSDSGSYSFGLSAAARGAKLSYDCQNSVDFSNTILNSYTTVIEGIPVPAGNVERMYVDLDHDFAYSLSPKTHLLAGGFFRMRDYSGNELTTRRYYNSEEWRARAGFGYSLSEKIRLDAIFTYGQIFRDPVSDLVATPPQSDAFGATIGARGSFTPRLSGRVRVGYEQRWFSDGVGDDGYPIASVDLTQRFTDKTSASLAYNHGGGVSATAFTRSVTVSDSFSLNLNQTLGYKRPWFLNLGIRYAVTDYTTSNIRNQENFQVLFRVSYQLLPWVSTYASYTYQYGTRSTYDYDDNQVTFGFHLGY